MGGSRSRRKIHGWELEGHRTQVTIRKLAALQLGAERLFKQLILEEVNPLSSFSASASASASAEHLLGARLSAKHFTCMISHCLFYLLPPLFSCRPIISLLPPLPLALVLMRSGTWDQESRQAWRVWGQGSPGGEVPTERRRLENKVLA